MFVSDALCPGIATSGLTGVNIESGLLMANLENSLKYARRLIQADSKGLIDKKVSQYRQDGTLDLSDTANYAEALAGVTRGGDGYAPVDPSVVSEAASRCKLPAPIIESFRNHPIDYGGYPGMGGQYSSILDQVADVDKILQDSGYDDTMLREDYQEQPVQRRQQRPQRQRAEYQSEPDYQRQYAAPQPAQGSPVDYSIIKMFIDEAVRKSCAELAKTVITESRGQGQNLKYIKIAGNKLNVVTDTGDLYEANLVFKKNVRKK